MYRGTTPTLEFELPFECCEMIKCHIAFSQNGEVVLEKTMNDCLQNGKLLSCKLSEEDTLKLDCSESILEIQLRVQCGEEKLASEIIKTQVKRILKDGYLNDISS